MVWIESTVVSRIMCWSSWTHQRAWAVWSEGIWMMCSLVMSWWISSLKPRSQAPRLKGDALNCLKLCRTNLLAAQPKYIMFFFFSTLKLCCRSFWRQQWQNQVSSSCAWPRRKNPQVPVPWKARCSAQILPKQMLKLNPKVSWRDTEILGYFGCYMLLSFKSFYIFLYVLPWFLDAVLYLYVFVYIYWV